MTRVMLTPGLVAPFRRCVRNRKGKPVKTLVFEPGEVLTMQGRDLDAVSGDIGAALVEVEETDAKGRPRFRREQVPEDVLPDQADGPITDEEDDHQTVVNDDAPDVEG